MRAGCEKGTDANSNSIPATQTTCPTRIARPFMPPPDALLAGWNPIILRYQPEGQSPSVANRPVAYAGAGQHAGLADQRHRRQGLFGVVSPRSSFPDKARSNAEAAIVNPFTVNDFNEPAFIIRQHDSQPLLGIKLLTVEQTNAALAEVGGVNG